MGNRLAHSRAEPIGQRCATGQRRWRIGRERRLSCAVLTLPILWLSGCAHRERDAGAAYLQARSALRTGDFRESLAMAQEGLRRWPTGDWGWQFRLVCAEDLIVLSRVQEARTLLETPGAPSSASVMARLQADRARVALGPQADRVKLMRDALQAALASGDTALVCVIRLRMGDSAANFDEAWAFDQAALADAEHEHDPYLLAWARLDLGFRLAQVSRFDEAIPILNQAIASARESGAKSFQGIIVGNLGWCYLMLGDIDRAQDAFTQAETLCRQIGLRDYQHRWLGQLGNVFMIRGELDRAADYQRRAAGLAREVGNDAWLAIALTNLTETSLDQGDLAAAQTYNDQALAIKHRQNDPWSLLYSEALTAEIDMRARRYEQARKEYGTVIAHAPGAHAPSVLWYAHGRLGALYQQTGQPASAEAEYRKSIETIDREWNRLSGDEWKATFLAPETLIGLFRDYVDFLIRQGQAEKALEIAESSRARVLNQRLEHRGAVPPGFRIAQLAAAAQASHTVILSYWLAPKCSSVWVIAAGRLSRFDLPPAKQLAALVGTYTSAITQGDDPLARQDGSASALYQALLGPVQALIPPGSNVIVVPDGVLHQLNFETLVVPGPPRHYWIEDATIATAPSLRVLSVDHRKAARTPKLLLLGDPVLTGQDFAPLPHVKEEIAAIADQFPAADRAVITGASATPDQYAKAKPADFTDIHFATHATANRKSPLNSAIILSRHGDNFKLYARDVADAPLSADLVTISACTSAGVKAYAGEGLMGFAWAFLQAGAQNVIASLWDVDDARSVDIMRRLYTEMAAGRTPPRALREAKLALLRAGGSSRLPYYWGPLQVFTRHF